MAVWLVVHFHEFKGQVLFEFIDHQAGAAVTGVADNGQRAERTGIDIPQEMVHVGAHHLKWFVATLLRCITEWLQHPVANLVQTVIGADRPGFRADHFHAVVIFGIVAGSHHNAAVHLVMAGGKIHLLGAAQADIKHIRAGGHEAGAECLGNVGTGQPDVVAHDDFFRASDFHVSASDFFGQDRIQLIGNPASQVVGFKTGQVHCLDLLRGG